MSVAHVRALFRPDTLPRVSSLTPAERSVFNLLCVMASGAADDFGEVWPSVATVAERTNLERRAVQRSLRTLEAAGLIAPVPTRCRRSVTYRVMLRTMTAEQDAQASRYERATARRRAARSGGLDITGEPDAVGGIVPPRGGDRPPLGAASRRPIYSLNNNLSTATAKAPPTPHGGHAAATAAAPGSASAAVAGELLDRDDRDDPAIADPPGNARSEPQRHAEGGPATCAGGEPPAARRRPQRPRPVADLIPASELPACIPPEAWAEWEAWRRTKKRADWTPRAASMAVRSLVDLHAAGYDVARAIRHSIGASYQGIVPAPHDRPAARAAGTAVTTTPAAPKSKYRAAIESLAGIGARYGTGD